MRAGRRGTVRRGVESIAKAPCAVRGDGWPTASHVPMTRRHRPSRGTSSRGQRRHRRPTSARQYGGDLRVRATRRANEKCALRPVEVATVAARHDVRGWYLCGCHPTPSVTRARDGRRGKLDAWSTPTTRFPVTWSRPSTLSTGLWSAYATGTTEPAACAARPSTPTPSCAIPCVTSVRPTQNSPSPGGGVTSSLPRRSRRWRQSLRAADHPRPRHWSSSPRLRSWWRARTSRGGSGTPQGAPA